jgi:hypothetical protein
MTGEEVVAHKRGPYGIFLAIAVVYWLALLLLYVWPSAINRTTVEWLNYDLLVQLGYLIIALCLFATAFWKITLSTSIQEVPLPIEKPEEATEVEEEPERAAPKVEAKPPAKAKAAKRKETAVSEADLPEGLKAGAEDLEMDLISMPRKVDWPPEEIGTVYADTPVLVDMNLVLNLRSPIGKVCRKCEELDACMRRVKDKLDKDVFLFNFECKEGLKKQLQKARKDRQKKTKAQSAKADAAKDKVKATAKKAKAAEKDKGTAKAKPKAKAKGKKGK